MPRGRSRSERVEWENEKRPRRRGRSRGGGVGGGERGGGVGVVDEDLYKLEKIISTLFSYFVKMLLFRVISYRFVPFRNTK
jgi:hypothetical protein